MSPEEVRWVTPCPDPEAHGGSLEELRAAILAVLRDAVRDVREMALSGWSIEDGDAARRLFRKIEARASSALAVIEAEAAGRASQETLDVDRLTRLENAARAVVEYAEEDAVDLRLTPVMSDAIANLRNVLAATTLDPGEGPCDELHDAALAYLDAVTAYLEPENQHTESRHRTVERTAAHLRKALATTLDPGEAEDDIWHFDPPEQYEPGGR